MADVEPLWTPDQRRSDATRLAAFRRQLEKDGHGPLETYEALHWLSVSQPEVFWSTLWDFVDVIGDKGERIIESAPRMRDVRFFPDAELNIAENLLRPNSDPDDLVIIGANEDGLTERITRASLAARVGRTQAVLQANEVGVGDVVAILLPNVAEACIVMLAAVGLGATIVTTSPDFGVDGVLDRFGQVEPKVLVAANGYVYGGRRFDTLDKVKQIANELSSLQAVYVVEVVDDGDDEIEASGLGSKLSDAVDAVDAVDPVFVRLPFDHPLYVLFSSGTTGKPKPMVHRAGGVLLTHMKEHQLACDIRSGDRVFYFTTTGWMMWNWLMSVIASDAAIVLYDGNPAHPRLTRLFNLVDNVGVTFFGTSAKFIESLLKAEAHPADRHGLSTIRSITSTGSPLSAEGFEYVYSSIAPEAHLASMSGGTDLCGCFVGGDPTGPVYSGEIQRPMLGMAVDVFDDVGRAVAAGVQGELVCTKAFPSMPLTFLGDDGDERYNAAYFERFDNVWHQGDFAEWTPHGGLVIHGRSDATLNPGGVRIGTAEIYAQVEKIDEVLESLVIGQQHEADTRVVLFVRLRDGQELTDELTDHIRQTIRAGATPRHMPAKVVAVDDLPRTRSGKIAEIAVREIVHGREVKNQAALANPEALDLFVDLDELS